MFTRAVDIAWLAAFRVLFGLTMAFSALRFIAYGWIDDFYIRPTFHFKYYGFEWVQPLAPAVMHTLFWALAALSLCIAAGFFFRITATLFFLAFTYLQLIDVATYLNHYYLACILALLLAVSPAHRAYSLDSYLGRVEPLEYLPQFWLSLFRFQVGVVYTFAGLAKLNTDWLLHAQPLGIWLSSRTDTPLLGPIFAEPWAPLVMSWAGFLFDLTIIWFLRSSRTRLPAYAALIAFHVLTRVLFPIGMFPAIMILSALVFFPPDWPRFHRFSPSLAPASIPVRRPLLAAALLFAIIQVALPLRHFAYGENILWHEQGMRFSWRVMVREKNGAITYYVRNKDTGRVWPVSPNYYLTAIQARELSSQPDLILQLAHHIRDDFQKNNKGPVEVRVEARVSLNGRPSRLMVDPTVDLAVLEDSISKAHWIAPAPLGAPPQLTPIKLSLSDR